MTAPVQIPFHGTSVLTVDVAGKHQIVMKPFFEAIGLDARAQLRKAHRKSWASVSVTTTQVPGDTQAREQAVCDVRTALMLLATVDEARVSEDKRPLLIAYQSEVADAIEGYFTEGGVINPRATEDQLASISARALQQAQVLKTLEGIVDSKWLEAKARHVAARALGEEPEVNPADRPLTVGEYLNEKGLPSWQVRHVSSKFGKRLKAAHYSKHGRYPMTVDRFIDGAMRPVAAYTEGDRQLFDRVLADLQPDLIPT